MALRTGNPVLGPTTFSRVGQASSGVDEMTLQGTIQRSFLLLAIALVAASFGWTRPPSSASISWALGASVAALVVGVVTVFRAVWSPFLAPPYAAFEGLALGAISALVERRFPGSAIQAVGLTFGVFLVLLSAYSSGLVRPSENFKAGVISATGAVCLVYAVSLVAQLRGHPLPYIHDSGPIGIAFSVFVVGLAAANLVLDFDFIESGVSERAPRYMEWYAAFGLVVTLFWLYLEMLRLLAKLKRR